MDIEADKLAQSVLRVHPEPSVSVSDASVHTALTRDASGYMRFLEARLQEIASGSATIELPPKRIFPDGPGRGDFRVMPCVFRSADALVKTVKIVGTNLEQVHVPDQVTVGKAFCLHPSENFITHIFDACLLSSARTGACVAVAARYLADTRRRVSIVGAGRVAFYAARYMAALGGIEEIIFSDIVQSRAAAAAELAQRELGGSVECRHSASPDLEKSDVVVFATTSTEPLWRKGDVSASVVISVGADTEEQRELDSSFARGTELYTDSRDSQRVGDLRAWIAEGAMEGVELTELVTLVARGPSAPGPALRVFVSTGSALFDNLTIAYLLSDGVTG